MAPYKSPLEVVGKTRRDVEPRSLAEQVQDPDSLARLLDLVEQSVHLFPEPARRRRGRRGLLARNPSSDPSGPSQLVTGPLPTGDETQATPAPRRQPEHDASLGGSGAGIGQHLSLVEGRVIDAADRFNAHRRRNDFNNGSAA